jgi:F-type H+-transporting ATPase subunit a
MNGRTIGTILVVVALALIGRVALPLPAIAHIQLPAETVAHLGGFPVTNTLIAAVLASAALLFVFWRAGSAIALVPSGLQNFIEFVVEFLIGLCNSVAGAEKGRRFFPLVATLFLFIVTSNWMGLLPGYGTIGIWEKPHPVVVVDDHAKDKPGAVVSKDGAAKPAEAKPTAAGDQKADDGHSDKPILVAFLRSAATDLNTTLALALISVIATQVFGLRALGGEYLLKFFNYKEGPIGIFVGLLEIVAEFARVLSFTFRLFGNVFAGEVVLAVVTFLLPWIGTLPFLGLELFVGFIQALVFAMLTLVFLSLATISHSRHSDAAGHAPAHAGHH